MFGLTIIQSVVTGLLENVEMFHHAIMDPFMYLLHFLSHTETFQNLIGIHGYGRQSMRSTLYMPERYSVERKLFDIQPVDCPQPRSYSIIDALNNFPNDNRRIYLPSELHEPMTMLQRLTEMFEFSLLLDAAAITSDIAQQLTYVATFINLSYSTLYERITKPFTPLLGETFECDRFQELGWRCISEHIEDVPSVSVVHCESNSWVCRQEFSYDVKIYSTYISVSLKGYVKVKFTQKDCEYMWERNDIKIYNHIMGKMIPEIQGTTKVVGLSRAEGYACLLRYSPRSELVDEHIPDMEGYISYRKKPLVIIRGSWRDGVSASPITLLQNPLTGVTHMASNFHLIYKKPPIPSGRELTYYNMSQFASNLNRMEKDIAPTDSRLRNDVRTLDIGSVNESNTLKQSLEEKQFKRISDNWNKPSSERYTPAWFTQNESGEWMYNGQYWICKEAHNWSRCPHIF